MLPAEYRVARNISALQKFRDFFAASIVFPGSMVVNSFTCVYLSE